jgi:hypothetical protein
LATLALKAPDGTVPSVEAAIYIAPLEAEVTVLNGRLVCTHTAAVTIQLYKQNTAAGTKRRIAPVDLVLQPGDKYTVEGFTLAANGQIRASASVASVVDWSFSVLERTD